MTQTIRKNRRKYIPPVLLFLVFLLFLLFWPLPSTLTRPVSPDSVRITDRNGALLYERRHDTTGLKQRIALKDVPPSFRSALIAVEDHGFYSHWGVSVRGIGRAVIQNVTSGEIVSGASTITQQLVRNKLQPKRRGFAYKLYEAWTALRLERGMDKDEILEEYLNTAYFGHLAYGLQSASRTYFGKDASLLSTSESAFLAGLLQSPSALDPFVNMKGALKRRGTVLAAMRGQGMLDEGAYTDALEQPIALAEDRIDIRAPHFVMWLLSSRPELAEDAGEIRTTLDLNLQTQVEAIVSAKLDLLAEKNVTSAAVTVLDAKTGDVLAMVGSGDYFDKEHDGAVNVALAPRQPGSTMKPFTYALALAKGMTAATAVADVESRFFTKDGNPYTPRNYDYGYHGLVRLREALANSYNIAAVKVMERVGVANLLSFLQETGISTLGETPEHYGLALTLGDAEVRLLELTQAYGMFARGGVTLPVRTVASDPAAAGKRVLEENIAWLISDILSDDDARLAEFGEGGALEFGFPVAAKTGTTRNSRDNWTIGYTPDHVVGVWVGNADNSPMKGTSGITGAAPIFHEVMEEVSRGTSKTGFRKPADIVDVTVCKLSGKLPTDACTLTVKESFIRGTEPKENDDIYRTVAIDSRNGLLGDGCDPRYVIRKAFTVFPAETRKWARENGWQEPPSQRSPLCTAGDQTADITKLTITRPSDQDAFLLDPMIPDEHENIILEARAGLGVQTAEWFVDGQSIGNAKAPDFRKEWHAPGAGVYKITVKVGAESDEVTVHVE